MTALFYSFDGKNNLLIYVTFRFNILFMYNRLLMEKEKYKFNKLFKIMPKYRLLIELLRLKFGTRYCRQ